MAEAQLTLDPPRPAGASPRPLRLATQWSSSGRGLSRRRCRLTRVLSLSPLLFACIPGVHDDAAHLLVACRLATPTPHLPFKLGARRRHLVALADQIIHAFSADLKNSEDQEKTREDFLEFLNFLKACENCQITKENVSSILSDNVVTSEIQQRFWAKGDEEGWSDKRDVNKLDISAMVFLVLSFVCKVSLNLRDLNERYETIRTENAEAVQDLRNKGNKSFLESDPGDYHAAVNLYTAGILTSPFSHTLHRNRGQCFFEMGQFELAVTDSLQALILEPTFKSASYLLGESLYKLREAEAAKAVNRQSSVVSKRLVADDVNGLGDLEAQLGRWMALERDAKTQLHKLLHLATTAQRANDSLAAIAFYGRADDVIDEFGSAALGLETIDGAVMTYCRCMAYVQSGIPYYMDSAIAKLEEVLEDSRIKFPLAFLGLAKAFQKRSSFLTAISWADKGLEVSRRGVRTTGGCHYWPGTQFIIEETKNEKLEQSLNDVRQQCVQASNDFDCLD